MSRIPSSERRGLGRALIEKALPYQLDVLTQLGIGDAAVRCVLPIALDESQEFV